MSTPDPINVVIADDHPIFRKGIRELLAGDPRFSVVEEVGHGDSVLAVVRKHAPGILLLDLNMPGTHGLDLAADLRSSMPDLCIVVMTMHKEEEMFDRALNLGVHGYLLKECAEDDLLECLGVVLEGDSYVSPQLSKYLLQRRKKHEAAVRLHPQLDQLSPAERRVLLLVAEYKTSKEIAEILHVSTKTVHNHRFNICTKLNIRGVNGLLKFATGHRSSL